ncbi:MAG: L-idonate 5-dehydrogenase [Actinomycetes bacterium]
MKSFAIRGKEDALTLESEAPVPAEGQVRIRVRYVGICGSDLHYYYEGANGAFVVKEPLVPGHELSGVIDLDPQGEWAPGTPVTVHPATFGPDRPGMEDLRHLRPGGSYLGSASTWPHTQGGLQELLLVGREMIRVLPTGLDLRRAALAEPLAVALHACTMAGDLTGRSVVVSGAGPIGLLVAYAARSRGAARVAVADVLAGPLARAKQLGFDESYRAGETPLPAGEFDVAMECSGARSSIAACIDALRPRGVLTQVGMLPARPLELTLAALVSKELTWVGCFRFNDEIDEAVELLASSPGVDAVISHIVHADRIEEALSVAKDSEASGKVLVEVWDS